MTDLNGKPEMSWEAFAGGSSIGQAGSEDGIITRDEAHPLGARITLEREPAFVPFAVTCGIYGWMVHTRYFATEGEAQAAFEEMKPELARILDLIPPADDPEAEAAFPVVARALEDFVKRFPRVDWADA
jgi:hypothetical protein